MPTKSNHRESCSGKADLPNDFEERFRERAYHLYGRCREVEGLQVEIEILPGLTGEPKVHLRSARRRPW
jgi:hypothetical protein